MTRRTSAATVTAVRLTKVVAVFLVGLAVVMFLASGVFIVKQSANAGTNALVFTGVGLLFLLEGAILLRRSRASLTLVAPTVDLARTSGPFGLDGPRVLDTTRVYRLRHDVFTTTWTGAVLASAFVVTALRIQFSLLSGIFGGAIALALSAYLALALQRSSLEVGPQGITLSGVRMRKTIPWSAVESVGVRNGRCIVRIRNAATGRNPFGIRNRDLSAYLRVKENVSMPGLIAGYLSERTPAPQPLLRGRVPPPVDLNPPPPSLGERLGLPAITTFASPFMAAIPLPPPLSAGQERLMDRHAGLGIRLAAWSIDVVVIAVLSFVVTVLIDAIVDGANGGNEVTAYETQALLAGSGVTLVVYLIVCWHGGATLGMWILRLRVIDSRSGNPPSWGRSTVRFVAALPSIVVFIPFGLIGVLGYDRLALHDRPAKTLVVSITNKGLPLPDEGPPGATNTTTTLP